MIWWFDQIQVAFSKDFAASKGINLLEKEGQDHS